MNGRTDSSRKGGGAGLELHICMHRMVNWAERTPPKVASSNPMHSLHLLHLPHFLWGRQQCNTPSKLPAFFGRQNSGPPSTSFTIGPRFAEIRA